MHEKLTSINLLQIKSVPGQCPIQLKFTLVSVNLISRYLVGKAESEILPSASSTRDLKTRLGFCSTKQLGVFLLPLGWDASPLKSYPQH